MSTVLNVKIDEKLKKEAQKAAKDLGLPMSIVVAAGLREFVRTRSITISDEPRLKPAVEAELLRLSAEAKEGVNVSPAFTNAEDAITWLHANED
jgi:addiction module RelB/DinJ family antitoxin